MCQTELKEPVMTDSQNNINDDRPFSINKSQKGPYRECGGSVDGTHGLFFSYEGVKNESIIICPI